MYFDGIQLFKERFGSYYTYDGRGNHTQTTDVNGGTTTYTYNEDDEVTSVEQADGTQTGYEYDDYHNLTKVTTATGVVYEYGYNAYGNNTSVTVTDSGVSMTTCSEYTDDGNYLKSTTDAANAKTQYGYNLNTGVLEWVQHPGDSAATQTTYTYDSMYRLASAAANTGSQNLSVAYAYTDDMLTAVTTGSTTFNFTYGDFGLRSSVKVGNRTLAIYSYTNRTNLLQILDYGNGDSVQYTYDDMGRVVTETYENGRKVTYSYNNDGAVATVTDTASGITETYYYDTEDRLVKLVESGSGYSHIIEYTYNILGNITNVREEINGYPTDTTYLYDWDGRVVSVASGLANKQYSYDDFGRVTQQVTQHNGQPVNIDVFTYEAAGNATSGRVTSLQTAAGTYTYTYDAKGNIASVTFGGKTTTYVYDSQNQLIRENNHAGGYTYVWTYDNAGNILSRTRHAYTTGTPGTALETLTYTYGNATWGDLLTKINNLSITYDTVGNPIDYYNGNSFTWENGRRLSTMAVGMSTWTIGYDNSGMRIRRTDGTTDYRYAYNGGSLTQMTVGNVTLDFAYAANGAPMSVIYDGLVYYYVTNLQGDVTAILNHFGIPVVEYTYDAWGNILSTTGSMASTLGQLNPLRYRGYVYDSETGFYYLQSRYYDPNIGRFINADDIAYLGADGSPLSYNLFAYCSNNPVSGYDPTGHFSWKKVFKVAAVVTIAALAVVAVVGSGGTAAPPLLAAASAIAGTTVTAAAATTVATSVAITGMSTMGVAAIASILESSSNQGKDYVQAKNNKTANKWAQEVGYDDAEALKKDFVGESNGSKFNLATNRATKEILLVGLRIAVEVATGLFRK